MKISPPQNANTYQLQAFLASDDAGNYLVQIVIHKPRGSKEILAHQLKIKILKNGREVQYFSRNPSTLIEVNKSCSSSSIATFQINDPDPKSIEDVKVSYAGNNYKFKLVEYEANLSK